MRVFDETRIASLIRARDVHKQGELVRLVAESGAVLDHHFVLAGQAHSQYFLRFRSLGADAELAQRAANEILATNVVAFENVTLVAPESAGFFLADALRRLTGAPLAVLSTDAQRRPSSRLRPHDALQSGTRVVLVNDVATTGASLEMLKERIDSYGASLAGVVFFAMLGTTARAPLERWGAPAVWLVEPTWPTFSQEECPLCASGKSYVLSLELS